MFGNLMRESGVVDRLVKTASNELANITTIFLGITIGATMVGASFANLQTLIILVLGILAFGWTPRPACCSASCSTCSRTASSTR